jgi:hypothetical protein
MQKTDKDRRVRQRQKEENERQVEEQHHLQHRCQQEEALKVCTGASFEDTRSFTGEHKYESVRWYIIWREE